MSDQTFEEFHADCGPECECYAAKHPMTAPLPTPAEVAQIRERHVREVLDVHPGYGEEAWCPTCRVHWPCDAARLLTLVDNLREEVFDHWCTPGCDDGCDIAKTRRLTTDTIVIERRAPLTDDETADLRARLDRIRRAATGEGS